MDTPVVLLHHIPKTGGQTIRNSLLSSSLRNNIDFWHIGPFGAQSRIEAGIPSLSNLQPDTRNRIRVVAGHGVHRDTALLFPDRPVLRVIVLREPVAWITSFYDHYRRFMRKAECPALGFQDWFTRYQTPAWITSFDRDEQWVAKGAAETILSNYGGNPISAFVLSSFFKSIPVALSPGALSAMVCNVIESNFDMVVLLQQLPQLLEKLSDLLKVRIVMSPKNIFRASPDYYTLTKEERALFEFEAKEDMALYAHFAAWECDCSLS